MKIYLDNCCFNRPFDDQSQLKIKLETDAKLFIQKKVLEGEFKLIWSYILEMENNHNPYEDRKNSIAEWKNIASEWCSETEKIIEFAETLFSLGVKSKDALHISCAVDCGCDYFITTDKKLLNTFVTEIKVVSPLAFIDRLENENE